MLLGGNWRYQKQARFPFTKKSRKFRLGCKWNTTFWFVPLEIFRNKRISEKVVPFSRWKLPNGNFVFHLQISRLYCFYQQFQTFRGLLTGQASLGFLECNLWQMERALPKSKFPIEIFRNFCKWKTPANADVPTCDSTCKIFVEPQETPFLSSITENLESITVDRPVGNLQSTIRDIQIENERLRK